MRSPRRRWLARIAAALGLVAALGAAPATAQGLALEPGLGIHDTDASVAVLLRSHHPRWNVFGGGFTGERAQVLVGADGTARIGTFIARGGIAYLAYTNARIATHLNFEVFLGVCFGKRERVSAGWLHFSNASNEPDNLGEDFLALSLSF